MKSRLSLKLGSLVVFAMSPSAHAATGTWNVDTNGLWSVSGNWTPGIADGSGFTANFTNNITADRTVSLDTDRTLTSVVFGDSDTSSAGSWILDNGGTSTNNLILAGTTPGITVNALGTGKTATISAIIEGTAGLVKSGSGVLVLSGANTYTGATTINLGELRSGASDVIADGSSVTVNATTAGTALFNLNGNSDTINNLTFGGTGGLVGSVNQVTTGAGTLTLGGQVTVDATGNWTTGALISGKLNLYSGTGNIQRQFAVADSSGAAIDLLVSADISETSAGATSLFKNSAGFMKISGNNSWDGNTMVREGTLQLGSNTALPSTPRALQLQAGNNNFNTTNAILDLGGFNATVGAITLSNASTAFTSLQNNIIDSVGGGLLKLGGDVTYNAGSASFENGTSTISAALDLNGGTRIFTIADSVNATTADVIISGAIQNSTGTAGLTKAGAGVLSLTGANSYNGTTSISAGTLALSGGNNRLPTGTTVNFTGTGTLDIGSTSQTVTDLAVVGAFTGTVNGSGGSLSLAPAAFRLGSASGGVSQTLNMAGLSSFTYNNSAGTFNVGSTFTTNSSASNSTLTLAATNTITASAINIANVVHTSATTASAASVNLGQTNTLNADSITVGGGRAETGTLQFQALTNPTLSIRAKNGTGRADMLIGEQTSAGVLNTGTVDLSAGSTDALIGTLTIGKNSRTTSSTTNLTQSTGSFTMGAGTLDATAIIIGQDTSGGTSGSTGSFANGTFTFGTGGGTVKVTTLTLGDKRSSSTNLSVSGTFNLSNNGTLKAQTIGTGASASAAVTRTFTWDNGTIQNYDASTDLTISTGLTLTLASAGTHTFNIDTNRTGTVAAVLAGTNGTLAKTGNGTLILSNTNTYSGATTVNGGTFHVIGSINNTSAVNINSGTLQLGASNVINNAAEVNLGGGTLASGGFSEGAATAIGLGVLSLSANSTIDFGTGAVGILNFSSLGTHTASTTLSILNWSGTALVAGSGINDRLIFGGTDITTFTSLYNQADVSFNGISGYQAIQFDSNYFEVVAVPEPGSLVLGGLGLLSLLRRRRGARSCASNPANTPCYPSDPSLEHASGIQRRRG